MAFVTRQSGEFSVAFVTRLLGEFIVVFVTRPSGVSSVWLL